MRRAFTLIELLVVVSIIALLIAILLPVLGNMKESTQKTICATRLKSITDASFSFAADGKGRLPDLGPEIQKLNDSAKEFEPYLGDPNYFWCPNYGFPLDWVYDDFEAPGDQKFDFGYVYIANRSGPQEPPAPGFPDSGNWASPTSIDELTSDKEVDADRQESPVSTYLSRYTHTPNGWAQLPAGVTPSEAGADGGNTGFGDGSVRWVPTSELQPHSNNSTALFWW